MFYIVHLMLNKYITKLIPNKCDELVMDFINICDEINFPVSFDKTEWSSQIIVFLGMLLNTITQTISIPLDKRQKAMNLLKWFCSRRKATVLKIQQLAGLLNFICYGVVVG